LDKVQQTTAKRRGSQASRRVSTRGPRRGPSRLRDRGRRRRKTARFFKETIRLARPDRPVSRAARDQHSRCRSARISKSCDDSETVRRHALLSRHVMKLVEVVCTTAAQALPRRSRLRFALAKKARKDADCRRRFAGLPIERLGMCSIEAMRMVDTGTSRSAADIDTARSRATHRLARSRSPTGRPRRALSA